MKPRPWRNEGMTDDNRRQRSRYWRLKSEGKCPQCSKPAGDTVLCDKCYRRQRELCAT